MHPYASREAHRCEMEKQQIIRSILAVERQLAQVIDETQSPEVLDVVKNLSYEVAQGFRGHEPRIAQLYLDLNTKARSKQQLLQNESSH